MAKVTIGCKLPNGLTLELIDIPTEKVALFPRPAGKKVILNGAYDRGERRILSAVKFEYGTTMVEEEFWNAWVAHNKDLPFVKDGSVFKVALGDQKSFASAAKDGASVPTGLEPLKPEGGDGRQPLGVEADKAQLRRFGAIS